MNFKDLHINIKVRIFVLLLQSTTSNMILPFMSIYFSIHYGVKLAGLIMLFTVIGSILAGFYGGYLADQFGRKKILVISEFIRFLTIGFMALTNSPLFTIPIITMVLLFINNSCFGLANPAREAMIIDVSTPETRKFIYSLTYWVNNFSLAIGTLLGAFLFNKYFFYILLVTTVVILTTCIVMYYFIEETRPQEFDNKKTKSKIINIFSSYRDVFKDKLFLKFFIASLLTLGIELQLGYYIGIRLANEFKAQTLINIFGLNITLNGVEMYGVLRTENTILVIILAFLVAKLTKSLSDQRSLYMGILLFTFGYMVLGVSNNAWVLLLSTVILTIGELMYVPIKRVLLADVVKESMRSRYMAVNSLTFRGGLVMGSLGITLGALIPAWGMSIIYGLMGFVSILLFSKVYKGKKEINLINLKGSAKL